VAAEAVTAEVRQARTAQISDAGAVQTQQAVKQSDPVEANRQQVEDAAKAVNEFIKPLNNSLQFNIDDDTGKTVVKVIDTATKEVIRQFPSEEMLSIAKAIDKMQGLLIHQKA
jgi:flagellar protein FlaG